MGVMFALAAMVVAPTVATPTVATPTDQVAAAATIATTNEKCPPVAACNPDADGYCTASVVRYDLSYDERAPRLCLNVAFGAALVVEFSDDVEFRSPPVVGNRAVFTVTTAPDTTDINVWATVPQGFSGDPEDLLNEGGNLHIRLADRINIEIPMRVAYREDGVRNVVFSFPERRKETSYVRERMRELRQKLETEYHDKTVAFDTKATEQFRQRLTTESNQALHCKHFNRLVPPYEMQDLLHVSVRHICRVGGQIVLQYLVENRSRDDLFILDTVSVERVGNGGGAVDDLKIDCSPKLDPITLRYGDGPITCSATFPEALDAASDYRVVVKEATGKGRKVAVSGVGF